MTTLYSTPFLLIAASLIIPVAYFAYKFRRLTQKLEAQLIVNSMLLDKNSELEDWQREAVEELQAMSSMLNLMNYHPTGAISARIKTVIKLIKQAEGE